MLGVGYSAAYEGHVVGRIVSPRPAGSHEEELFTHPERPMASADDSIISRPNQPLQLNKGFFCAFTHRCRKQGGRRTTALRFFYRRQATNPLDSSCKQTQPFLSLFPIPSNEEELE